MYDIQITTYDISLIIKKAPKKYFFYLIIGHTKTKEFPHTLMKIKYNAFMLKGYIIHFFTQQYW
jgi:D-alanyl-D-alanine carboxypeptidase